MLNKLFRGAADAVIRRPARLLIAAGVTPNALTLAGFAVVAGACWLIARGRLFAGGMLLGLGALFDVADGAVAKEGGSASVRGAFLDSTTDRLSDALLFFAIFWQYMYRGGIWEVTFGRGPTKELVSDPALWGRESQTGALLALAALVSGFLVSYIKARAEGLGIECRVGVAERPERVVLPILGLLLNQLIGALVILVVLSVITAVQRFVHVWRQSATLAVDGR